MKIVHLITTICRGGAENQLAILAKEQILSGHELSIIPLKGDLELLEIFEAMGATVDLRFYNFSFIKQWFKIKKLDKQEIDIIHLHLPRAEILGINIKKQIKICTRHFGGQFFPRKNRFLSRMLSKMASNSCVSIIAITNSVASNLRSNREIRDESKIHVVPYGFNLDFPEIISKLNANRVTTKNSNLLFGSLARLSEEKDLSTMIRGFAIAAENSKFEGILKVFGEGPERKNLEDLIETLGMTDRIFMPGRTSDPFGEIASFDVFILSSKFEGFGMVLLEAMAMNKPVICSRIESALEVLGESGAALFFPVGDAEKLADLLQDWSNNLLPEWQREQATQLSRYRADKMSERLQIVYETALSSKRASQNRKVS